MSSSSPNNYAYAPKNPIWEVLEAMAGVVPPDFVEGYDLRGLSDKQHEILQNWAVNAVRPAWLTGIGLLEAAEAQVAEAVSNGNIPPPPKAKKDPKAVLLSKFKRARTGRLFDPGAFKEHHPNVKAAVAEAVAEALSTGTLYPVYKLVGQSEDWTTSLMSLRRIMTLPDGTVIDGSLPENILVAFRRS